MFKNSTYWKEPASGDALDEFRHCHAAIVEQFERLRRLPELCLQPDAAAATKVAIGFIDFFARAILAHHEEEERDLFPAVVRDAAKGDEEQLVKALGNRLASEHRALEVRWKALSPDVKRVAKGKATNLDAKAIADFADAYLAHAKFEETVFLPLSKKILGPIGSAGLGMQIHARHLLDRLPAYI